MKFDPLDFIFLKGPLLGALVFLGVTWHLYNKYINYTEVTTGKVVEVIYQGTGSSFKYGIDIKYHVKQDNKYMFLYYQNNTLDYSTGDIVEIIYDKDKPSNAQINHFFKLWAGAIINGILGSIFLTIGIFVNSIPLVQGKRGDKYDF